MDGKGKAPKGAPPKAAQWPPKGKGRKPCRDEADGYQPGRGHGFGPRPGSGDSPSASSSSSEEMDPGVPWNHGAKPPPPLLRRGWDQPLPAPPGTRLPLPAPPGTPPGIYHRAVPAGPQPKSGTTVVDEAKVQVEETESEDESEDDPPPLEPIIEEDPIIEEEPIIQEEPPIDDNTTVAAVSPRAAP